MTVSSLTLDTFKSQEWATDQAETYCNCNTHLITMPCLNRLKVKERQVAKLRPAVIAANMIDGK